MARSARKPRSAGKTVLEDTTFHAPKAAPAEPAVSFSDVIAQQADEEGKTEEEVLAELAAPAPGERPVKPAGTSNLACTIRQHRANYKVALHPNGKKTQNNGDPVAMLLLNVSLADLKDFSGMRFDGRRYDHLNEGHARMCIGNLIRAEFKKGSSDVIEWLMAKQPVAPADEESEEAATEE